MKYIRIVRAATEWWKGLRPKGWSEDAHLRVPCVNCRDYREEILAKAVADGVAERRKKAA